MLIWHSNKNSVLHSNLNSYTNTKSAYSVPNILKKHMHTHKCKCLCCTHQYVNPPTHMFYQDSLVYERGACYKTLISLVKM